MPPLERGDLPAPQQVRRATVPPHLSCRCCRASLSHDDALAACGRAEADRRGAVKANAETIHRLLPQRREATAAIATTACRATLESMVEARQHRWKVNQIGGIERVELTGGGGGR